MYLFRMLNNARYQDYKDNRSKFLNLFISCVNQILYSRSPNPEQNFLDYLSQNLEINQDSLKKILSQISADDIGIYVSELYFTDNKKHIDIFRLIEYGGPNVPAFNFITKVNNLYEYALEGG